MFPSFGASPPLDDTGGDRLPSFPSGAEAPVAQGTDQVIMPNDGNRPVESVNSLATHPWWTSRNRARFRRPASGGSAAAYAVLTSARRRNGMNKPALGLRPDTPPPD